MNVVNTPIQLASVCSTLGELVPIWFKFENEEHQIERISIEQVLSKKEQKHCGVNYIVFICTAVVENKRHLIEIRYFLETHKWILFARLD